MITKPLFTYFLQQILEINLQLNKFALSEGKRVQTIIIISKSVVTIRLN